MPLYEYECKNCGLKFEAIRSMKDADSAIKCESCSSSKTKRALSTCFSRSDGKETASHTSHSCGHCAGGSCTTCH